MIENLVRSPHEVFNCKASVSTSPTTVTFTVAPTHQSSFSSTSPLVIRWADGSTYTSTSSTMSLSIMGAEDTFGFDNVSSFTLQLAFVKSSSGTVALALGENLASGQATTTVANQRNSVASTSNITISQVSEILLTITLSKQGGTWSVVSTK